MMIILDINRSSSLIKRLILAIKYDTMQEPEKVLSLETLSRLIIAKYTPTLDKMTELFSKKVSNSAKIRNRYNQVPHLTQDTNGKVTNSQKTPQTRAKRSALSQQVTTKHI